eukprot:GHUV01036002.1.p1 GENE.GHUV01036002.1~~GHUV01036002.1.p1  ORF type:complete len:137 (+),score=21.88 GHUV01036002.1:364-774(+)
MAHLLSREVAFGTAVRPARASIVSRATYKITIKSPRGGHETTFNCADNEHILDAAEATGLELPNSCRSGTCCTCAGRLVSGKVNQEEQNFLDDQQMEEGGWVLVSARLALGSISWKPSWLVVSALGTPAWQMVPFQ